MKALIKMIKMIREEIKLGNNPYWTFYNTLLDREFNRNPVSGDAAIINGHPELSLNIRDIEPAELDDITLIELGRETEIFADL